MIVRVRAAAVQERNRRFRAKTPSRARISARRVEDEQCFKPRAGTLVPQGSSPPFPRQGCDERWRFSSASFFASASIARCASLKGCRAGRRRQPRSTNALAGRPRRQERPCLQGDVGSRRDAKRHRGLTAEILIPGTKTGVRNNCAALAAARAVALWKFRGSARSRPFRSLGPALRRSL